MGVSSIVVFYIYVYYTDNFISHISLLNYHDWFPIELPKLAAALSLNIWWTDAHPPRTTSTKEEYTRPEV